MEEAVRRVKVPTEKWTLPLEIVCGIILLAAGIFFFIDGESLPLAIFCVVTGAIILLVLPFFILKQIKLNNLTNTYPEEAIIIGDSDIEIITDKSEIFSYEQIKSVRGVRYVGAGFMVYRIYYYGTMFIKLKDGRKIVLKGIEDVSKVAKTIKQKMKQIPSV